VHKFFLKNRPSSAKEVNLTKKSQLAKIFTTQQQPSSSSSAAASQPSAAGGGSAAPALEKDKRRGSFFSGLFGSGK